MESFKRIVEVFPESKEKFTRIYWIDGEAIGRARYLPCKLRIEILKGLKEIVDDHG